MNNVIRILIASIYLVTAMMPLSAHAADKIKSSMHAYRVETVKGKETLKAAKEAQPGDTLEYRVTYANTTKEALNALSVVVPIPENTGYLKKTAVASVPTVFEVSLDGGSKWETEPVKRLRKNAAGKMVETIVPESEYTHLRWMAKTALGPKAVQKFSYRIQVD